MEQDVKLGSVGEVKVSEGMDGEKGQASVNVGPFKLSLVAEIDNRQLLEFVAAKVPGGFAHDAIIALEKVLFPAAAPAAPSA